MARNQSSFEMLMRHLAPALAILLVASATVADAAPNGRGWSAAPANTVAGSAGEENLLRMVTGKSLVLKSARTITRVSVANPETADVVLINGHQVMVNAIKAGQTSVIVWDSSNNFMMYNVMIDDSLQESVELSVTVAEVNRTEAERHGFDFRTAGGQFGGVTQYGNVSEVFGSYPPSGGTAPFPVSLAGELSWAVVDFKNDIAAFVRMVEENDFAHILAEPKLMARSGQKAKFLSGGEIPIVIAENDQTSIEFKEFGTKVEFLPTVEPDGNLRLVVFSEVSEPDFANGVLLNNFAVPAFVTRRAETDVRLRSGQSLVIAGLLKEQVREEKAKMPILGDIPGLGYLFSGTTKNREKLELVIIINPKILTGHSENTASNNAGGHNTALEHVRQNLRAQN